MATPPGSTSPILFEQWCGFFYVQQEQISKIAVRRDLQFFVLIRVNWKVSVTICRCHYKGSTLFSVILRTWVLIRPGLEPATSRSADQRTPWANQATVANYCALAVGRSVCIDDPGNYTTWVLVPGGFNHAVQVLDERPDELQRLTIQIKD